MKKLSEQKYIDLMFEIGLTIASDDWFKNKSQEEVANWIRKQLKENGIETDPVGSSWGVLIPREYPFEQYY